MTLLDSVYKAHLGDVSSSTWMRKQINIFTVFLKIAGISTVANFQMIVSL